MKSLCCMTSALVMLMILFQPGAGSCGDAVEVDSGGRSPPGRPQEQDVIGGSPSLPSLEWLIGKWRWVSKERFGPTPLALESICYFCAYPYMKYPVRPLKGRVGIPALFITGDTWGTLEGRFRVVSIDDDTMNILHPVTGHVLRYNRLRSPKADMLEIVWAPDESKRLRILFEKESDDPGDPIGEMVKERYSWPDSEEAERAYRDRKRLGQ